MHTTTKALLLLLSTVTNAASNDCCSSHPLFTLEPINLSSYYTYTTPSASGPKAGYISFALKHDGSNSTAACSGVTSMPLAQFYGSHIFECATQGGGRSSFAFDSYTGLIHVNSTWKCGGDAVYKAAISGTVKLQCETSVWQNPDWKRGELYSNTSTTCQPGSLVLQG
ncbi:hypothetical protein DE146DRAFT_393356 [Phaeosphaeria sp. MPI-PUGE-AT-0046c]|nr:hypothetical protein DE146DRAFT_393356 [Phaeosphaeria sp. MPI-PUGE-AT-0046c]